MLKEYPAVEKHLLRIQSISDAETAREQASAEITMREHMLDHEALAVNADTSIRIEDEMVVRDGGSGARPESRRSSHKASILRKVIAASAQSLSSEHSRARFHPLMTQQASSTLIPQRAPRFAASADHTGRFSTSQDPRSR